MRAYHSEAQFSRWEKYAPVLRRLPVGELTVANALAAELALYTDDHIGLFYAPFDHLEAQARIAIVGVTPGPTQAFASIRSARAALEAGLDDTSAQAAVKRDASFKGMRADLASWFDAVGLSDLLGLGSCAELFAEEARGSIHTTSAVRYPTFRRTATGWQPWSGYGISALEHPVLRGMIVGALGPELRALDRAVIVPLGKANEAVEHLCHRGQLDSSRCILGFPHPSPRSVRRHQIFAARRHTLERQVDRLRSRAASATRLARAAASAPPPATPAVNGEEIRIELTDGNVRNGHFYLRRHLAFFPEDAVGPANSADGVGNPLRVWFAGDPEAATTDIAGGNKLMFRCRARVAAFFRRHRLVGGDAVLVRRTGPREYQVRPQFA